MCRRGCERTVPPYCRERGACPAAVLSLRWEGSRTTSSEHKVTEKGEATCAAVAVFLAAIEDESRVQMLMTAHGVSTTAAAISWSIGAGKRQLWTG